MIIVLIRSWVNLGCIGLYSISEEFIQSFCYLVIIDRKSYYFFATGWFVWKHWFYIFRKLFIVYNIFLIGVSIIVLFCFFLVVIHKGFVALCIFSFSHYLKFPKLIVRKFFIFSIVYHFWLKLLVFITVTTIWWKLDSPVPNTLEFWIHLGLCLKIKSI